MTNYLDTLAGRAVRSADALQLQPRLRSPFEDAAKPSPGAAFSVPSVEPQPELWGEHEVEHIAESFPAVQRKQSIPRPGPSVRMPAPPRRDAMTPQMRPTIETSHEVQVGESASPTHDRPLDLASTSIPLKPVSAPSPRAQNEERRADPMSTHSREQTAQRNRDESPATAAEEPKVIPRRESRGAEAPVVEVEVRQHGERIHDGLRAAPAWPEPIGRDADAESSIATLHERTIRISIGRVDVRAIVVPHPPKQTAIENTQPLRLDEYLRQRDSRK
jgi:hypothetical protein